MKKEMRDTASWDLEESKSTTTDDAITDDVKQGFSLDSKQFKFQCLRSKNLIIHYTITDNIQLCKNYPW